MVIHLANQIGRDKLIAACIVIGKITMKVCIVGQNKNLLYEVTGNERIPIIGIVLVNYNSV